MQIIDQKLGKHHACQIQGNILHTPVFYTLSDSNARTQFSILLDTPGILVYDCLFEQLIELIKFKNPSKKFSDEDLKTLALNHIKPASLSEYGIWVYYPWSNKLVHILNEEEFTDLRTSRNQYKITREERNILAKKKIGVIGLSVGQSVSLTLCMERICGEIRLADFDTLELTNLNRIRAGLNNLGLLKVYAVAREIAEIDPFIKVKCFEKGVTENNIDSFFTEGGNLDLMIEESDGFDIKILSRIKARELKIPVLMEASDRCMVDIERFDLEPNRSILHGLVDHLDISTLKNLKTTEDKIPYMLDILGLDTASLRIRASMLEIEQTINTWPQLASAVTMGGGITADIARRILLDQYSGSGRFHVDIEEIIGDNITQKDFQDTEENFKLTDHKKLASELIIDPNPGQLKLSESEVQKIVIAGSKAPSGGNSQPWRWIYKNKSLLLFNAFDANSNFLGFNNYASYVAFGASIENITLRAEQMNLSAQVELFPRQNMPELVAIIKFFPPKETANQQSNLADGIDIRLTNRNLGERKIIEKEKIKSIIDACETIEGAKLHIFSNEDELNRIGELLGKIDVIRLTEVIGHRDFANEIRWTTEEAESTKDGIDLRTVDLSNSEMVGMKVSKNADVMALINKWNGGGAFKKLTKKSIDSAGAVGIISMPGHSAIDFMNGGRAIQRAWLTANLNEIAFQPMSVSVFMYARAIEGRGKDISEKGYQKLLELRTEFEKTFNIKDGRGEIFIFRLCKTKEPEIKSLRKPIEDILFYINND